MKMNTTSIMIKHIKIYIENVIIDKKTEYLFFFK